MTAPTPCPSCEEARANLAEEERVCLQVIGERDRREEQIGAIAEALGCVEEWTNCHDHGECALDAANELSARALAAESALADLRGVLQTESNERIRCRDGWALEAQRSKAALARVSALEGALRNVAHAHDGTDWCWCAYTRLTHPPDDPQDGVEVRDGHTEECWAARALLGRTT